MIYKLSLLHQFNSLQPLLRNRDVYPGTRFLPSRISDSGPKIQQQTFLCTHTFHTFENYFIFEQVRYHTEKIWAIWHRIYLFSTQKLLLSSQKYGLGIRDPEKTLAGIWIQGSKKHRTPDPHSTTVFTSYRLLRSNFVLVFSTFVITYSTWYPS